MEEVKVKTNSFKVNGLNGKFSLKKFLFGRISRKLILQALVVGVLLIVLGVVGYFSLENMNMAMMAGEYHSQLMGNTYKIMLPLLMIILVVVLLFSFFMARSITKPLDQLYHATLQIERKDFTPRVNIKTGDELEELGKAFNLTAQALGEMDAERKQLEKSKTEFLSITSHELRSPMTPMKAQLQMLLGGYFGKLNAKQKEALKIAERNTLRLDQIIVDFLEISRIEAARLKFRFVKVDLGKTVKNIAKEMKGFMPEKKIKIFTKIWKLPVIEADPNRVGQVIRNLIGNAIKFTKIGGEVHISAKHQNGEILFSIRDTGIGINKQDQEKLFEPFFQAEQTMYREHGGTGLGLAIARGIVESQNGKIWIDSEVGKGTVFSFTIPLKPVKIIKPIKLLFSQQEKVQKKLRTLFVQMLGPMGTSEFKKLKNEKHVTEQELLKYVVMLGSKKIISENRAQVFKSRIALIFGRKKEVSEKDISSFVKDKRVKNEQ